MKLEFKNLRHSFWAHIYRSTMQQKLVQQEAGAFGNNINCKSHAQNWKICTLYIYWEYLNSGSFLQTYINFVEQRLKFSLLEGSIIP